MTTIENNEENIDLLESNKLQDLELNIQEKNKTIMPKPMRSFIIVIQNVVNELEKHFPEDIDLIKELKKLKERFSYSAPEMNQIYWIKARNILFERFQDDLVKPLSEIPTNVDIVMRTFSGKNNLII